MTRILATLSAILLGVGGVVLLFAADVVLGIEAAQSPLTAVVAQLLGAAWLAVAAATWLSRGAVLGGIYGRSIVMANTWVFTVSALVCLRAFWLGPGVLAAAVVAALFATLYGYLLYRGPFGAPR